MIMTFPCGSRGPGELREAWSRHPGPLAACSPCCPWQSPPGSHETRFVPVSLGAQSKVEGGDVGRSPGAKGEFLSDEDEKGMWEFSEVTKVIPGA